MAKFASVAACSGSKLSRVKEENSRFAMLHWYILTPVEGSYR